LCLGDLADALRPVHNPSKSVDAVERLLPLEKLFDALMAESPARES